MTIGEGVSIGLAFLAIVAPDFWPKMPKAISYTLAAIGLAWLTYSAILGIEDYFAMKLMHGPLALIIAGAVFFAGGIFWHISRIPAHKTENDAGKIIPKKDSHKLFLECGMRSMPSVFPPEGRVFVLGSMVPAIETVAKMRTGNNIPGGMMELFGTAGAAMQWGPEGGMISGYKCELFNYGSDPIFNVRFAFTVIAFDGTNRLSSENKILLSGQLEGQIAKIDVGKSGSFVFYLRNIWPNIVKFIPPTEVHFDQDGEMVTEKLTTSKNMGEFIFFPSQSGQ